MGQQARIGGARSGEGLWIEAPGEAWASAPGSIERIWAWRIDGSRELHSALDELLQEAAIFCGRGLRSLDPARVAGLYAPAREPSEDPEEPGWLWPSVLAHKIWAPIAEIGPASLASLDGAALELAPGDSLFALALCSREPLWASPSAFGEARALAAAPGSALSLRRLWSSLPEPEPASVERPFWGEALRSAGARDPQGLGELAQAALWGL